MHSGTVEFTNFPSLDGVVPKPQVLQIPNMYAREGTGSVCTMEWSSDGYVLAVGWEKGWAIWSVGGRCLAWGFGVEYEVDEERFQDAFMYGVRSLVRILGLPLVVSVLTRDRQFWAPGNFELVMLAQSSHNSTSALFVWYRAPHDVHTKSPMVSYSYYLSRRVQQQDSSLP